MLRVVKTDPLLKMQQVIARSYSDKEAKPLPFTEAEILRVGYNTTSLVHPTFTQFLKKVRDDVMELR